MKDLLDIQAMPCDGAPNTDFLSSLPLAYAYVPYQSYEAPMSMEQSLHLGTIFPGLNKPYGVYGNEFTVKEGKEW